MELFTTLTVTIALIALIIGTITDIKTREVPDWLNYSLIASGIGIALIFSLTISKWSFFLNSIAGFGIFFLLAIIMFYTGQWGGGDSKIIMGLGAMLGVDITFRTMPFLAIFIINTLIVGSIYGIIWTIVLSMKNKKKLLKEMRAIFNKKQTIYTQKIIWIIFGLLFIAVFLIKGKYAQLSLLVLAASAVILFYLWLYIKAVEKSSMFKYVTPDKLTEGDWIAKNVIVNKKIITGPKDLGIEKKKIKLLMKFYKQGKIKKILIKEGIPFVPSFLIAFIVTLFFGNLLVLVI